MSPFPSRRAPSVGHRRSLGQRQDDAAWPARRARRAQPGDGGDRQRRPPRSLRGRPGPAARTESRVRLSGLSTHPDADGHRERPKPLELRGESGRRPGPRAADAWDWETGWITFPRSCRAANSSAWPSPAPFPTVRGFSSPTSPPATRRLHRRASSSCSSRSTARKAPPWCWSTHDTGLAERTQRIIRLSDGAVVEDRMTGAAA